MNKRFFSHALTCALLTLLIVSPAIAQTTSGFTHTVTSTIKSGQQPGRDFWFSIAQNYDVGGSNDKYYMLYISSASKTTVNIQITGSSTQKFVVPAHQVESFRIPISWEVTSSGVVENNGIHVWSYDADLSVYELSRNPASSDGMYVIPTVGWGKENVVASYSSLFELSFDYPSEFVVVSAFDNTTASITPTWDIRANHLPNTVLHGRDAAFSESFSRGQCAQYQLTQAQNIVDYDVTGTIVISNQPVGIVGASQCPNIPANFTYCDHICDMMPPVRTWGYNYYSLPFIGRKGGDSFRAIASVDNQTIYRADNNGTNLFAQLNKYKYYTQADIDVAQHWYSDKPFMLVQYINSTGWPDGGSLNNGIGDPAMVMLCPVEEFATHQLLQTPTIQGGQGSFSNFVNITLQIKAESTTLYDNVPIATATGGTKFALDTLYEGYRFVNQRPGTHSLSSSQPVGGYVYGYGSYDAYAWPIAQGTNSLLVTDTIAPALTKQSSTCTCSHLTIADSNLTEYLIDTLVNMNYFPDPGYLVGSAQHTSYYDLCANNPDSAARAIISVYDLVGNRTRILSVYEPNVFKLSTNQLSFADTIASIEVRNLGYASLDLSKIYLKNGHNGFSLDPLAKQTLAPGDSEAIRIKYRYIHGALQRDTLVVGDSCSDHLALLYGGDLRLERNSVRSCKQLHRRSTCDHVHYCRSSLCLSRHVAARTFKGYCRTADSLSLQADECCKLFFDRDVRRIN
jgi:hypothetical protein